jgi:hypothetical protein
MTQQWVGKDPLTREIMQFLSVSRALISPLGNLMSYFRPSTEAPRGLKFLESLWRGLVDVKSARPHVVGKSIGQTDAA